MNLKNLTVTFTLIAAFALLGIVVAGIVVQYLFPSTGIIKKTVTAVYFEKELMNSGDGIVWGDLTPGQTISGNLTVVNMGTTTINCTLHILDLPSYLTTGWNGNNTILAPGSQNILYTLSLTVALDAPATAFEFTYRLDIVEVP